MTSERRAREEEKELEQISLSLNTWPLRNWHYNPISFTIYRKKGFNWIGQRGKNYNKSHTQLANFFCFWPISQNYVLSNMFIHRKCFCFRHKHSFSQLAHISAPEQGFCLIFGLVPSLASLPDCATALKTTANWVNPLDVYWYWFHTADICVCVCVFKPR